MHDVKLECYLDWRYSAAVLGLVKFFEYWKRKEQVPAAYDMDKDYIEFDSSYITRERFLDFAENFFAKDMFHIHIEEILKDRTNFSDEQIKAVNESMKSNTIMKQVFANIKFDGNNKDSILKLIDENRYTIIEETFRNKTNMYRNYCNKNLLGKEPQPHCRLLGYSIDEGRKTKSYAYSFNDSKGIFSDSEYFDFIPFAFTNTFEALFINNNFSIRNLLDSNKLLNDEVDKFIEKHQYDNVPVHSRNIFYQAIINLTGFIDNDIEVISKRRDRDYFETLYIRKDKIKILKEIKDVKQFMYSYKVSDNYYIDVLEEVMDSIINGLNMDSLIDLFLKADAKKESHPYSYLISKLIEVNTSIKGVDNMKEHSKWAYASAKEVNRVLRARNQENKINSYKQKLISAITADDYKRVCDILLQLSSYTSVEFRFAYDLFEDFETNEEIAYTFINTLGMKSEKETKEGV